MHRFIGKFPISDDKFWIGDKELTHQIRDVLKLRVGEKIVLVGEKGSPRSSTGGAGLEAVCEIVGFDNDYVGVKVLENLENKNDPKTVVELYLAILKNENFELATQKAVEVGVSKIIPIVTERTIKTGLKLDRLKKIMKEASEQSGRGLVPEIIEPIEYKSALKLAKGNDFNVLYDPSGEDSNAKHAGKRIGIFIGPEGGWTEKEISMARVAHCKILSFGKLVYRAETAAIISVYEVVKSLK
jgi:16S rRNA (uracil1498-N3)-methyltransferase